MSLRKFQPNSDNRNIIVSFLKKNSCTIRVGKVNLKEIKQTEDMVQYKYELNIKIRKGKAEQEGNGLEIIKIIKINGELVILEEQI